MFDLSFAELLVIAVVALVVLGPERLPRAARFTGLWVRRARAQWQSVRSEFERELAAEELKRNLEQARSAMRDTDRGIRDADAAIRREAQQLRAGVTTTGTAPGATGTPDAAGAETDAPAAIADSAGDSVAMPSAHSSEPTGSDDERR
ncbi:twin-arginine translocase subunit TatB [Luteimonas yindakuii]|uniref:Sec-independent protein translocase protein TatB n=1 Tax=Luteimonas yindakuii TaxID=2565782 RepID=A0A4Z1RG04_9GAMM|nr:Sec-independent protein translocase protein TatB [Luteimonas yindakuii]TKS55103.1 twin-arginine translocase subunit TatB [Luteimonas yindakuii]